MFGIPNCDTIKKAKKWLASNEIEYEFCDYKKVGADEEILAQAINASAIDIVVNKRGTTYRKLSEQDKQKILQESPNEKEVIDLLCEHPSMIKRPILMKQEAKQAPSFAIGFSDINYQAFFNE